MKKIIILIILLLTLSSCSLTYELNIENDEQITENIEIILKENEFVENKPDEWSKIQKIYNVKLEDNNTRITLTRKVKNIEEILKNDLFKKYVGTYQVYQDNINIVFNDIFKVYAYGTKTYLPYIDLIKIKMNKNNILNISKNIEGNYEVINLNEYNKKQNLTIQIKNRKTLQTLKENIKKEMNEDSNQTNITLTIIIILTIPLLLVIYVYYKHKKVNEI